MRLHLTRLFCYVVFPAFITCHLALLHYVLRNSSVASLHSHVENNILSRKLRYHPEHSGPLRRQISSNTSVDHLYGFDQGLSRPDKETILPLTIHSAQTILSERPSSENKLARQVALTKGDEIKTYTEHNGKANVGSHLLREHLSGIIGNTKSRYGEHIHGQRYKYNCSNIDQIRMRHKIGHGVTKHVYQGTIGDDQVAIKMVTRNVLDVTSCMKLRPYSGNQIVTPEMEQDRKSKCYIFPNMKLMKEILILEQIYHPNLVKMLGYCVRSEQTESTSLQDHGVVGVYEYALRFYVSSLSSWTLGDRLATALEMADLLHYLEHSPLGSLRVSDFKEDHFLFKDGRVKLTDLDDMTSSEPGCVVPHTFGQAKSDYPHTTVNLTGVLQPPIAVPDSLRMCHYGLQCQGGICPGHNAKYNLNNMNRILFKNLLTPEGSMDMDTQIIGGLISLQHDLDRLKVTARDVMTKLHKLLNHPAMSL